MFSEYKVTDHRVWLPSMESVLEAKEAEDCRGAACMLDLPTECLQQCFPPRSVQLGIRVCR